VNLDLVIFDCDGVLVDSEVISCRAHAKVLTRHGYPITEEEVLHRFLGVSEREAREAIECETGRKLPDDFEDQIKVATLKFYVGDLKAIAGVADAIAAAGGLSKGGSSGELNLARPVVDGEQIVVSPDAPPAAPPPGAGGDAASVVVDLNTATAAELDTLPGVGPVMSARILEWRATHGRFASVDQLREISGIGARTFERLAPHVRV